MRRLLLAACVILMLISGTPSRADDPPPQTASDLLNVSYAAIDKGGLRAIGDVAPRIEAMLADADSVIDAPPSQDGVITLLMDSNSASYLLIAMAASANAGSAASKRVNAVHAPYSALSLLLGSYYVETGRYLDAERVLTRGLSLADHMRAQLARKAPAAALIHADDDIAAQIYSELSSAQTEGGRLLDAMKTVDRGLDLPALTAQQKALLLRHRGYALTELHRLKEAEQAYRDSLKLEAGNKTALNELIYLARLKAGAGPTQGEMYLPGGKAPKP